MQTEAHATQPPGTEPVSQTPATPRDITLIALWGILNLCSFFFVLEGAVVLLLLALATEQKIRLAWLGIPVLVGVRVLTGNLWWNSTGARESFPFLQILWVVLAAIVSVQSIYLFTANWRRAKPLQREA